MATVNCPDVRLDCFEWEHVENKMCHHAIPHEKGWACINGCCPFTHKHLRCEDVPVKKQKHWGFNKGQ